MPRGVDRIDEARLQGRLWTPDSLRPNGLGLWLDAADSGTLAIASGTITQWNDKSGRNNHVSQGTGGNQPTYTANRQNGLGVTTWSGGQQLGRSSVAGFSTNGNISSFYVARYGAVSGHAVFDTGDSNGTTRGFTGMAESSTIKTYFWNGSQVNVAFTDTTNFRAVAGRQNTSFIQILLDDGSNNSAASSGATLTTTWLSVGRLLGGSAYPLSGDIAEIILVNEYVSDRTRDRVMGYLAWKWGLEPRLAASSPFKNRPPLIGD